MSPLPAPTELKSKVGKEGRDSNEVSVSDLRATVFKKKKKIELIFMKPAVLTD